MPDSRERRRIGLWLIAGWDILLSSLFVPTAVSNLSVQMPPELSTYNIFYKVLSVATPTVLIAAVISLFLQRWVGRRPAPLVHRTLFWLLILRGCAQIGLSMVQPNEGLSNLAAFLDGAFICLVAGTVHLAYLYLHDVNKASPD